MSNARYIWSVATAMRSRVRPHVTDNAARDALDNGIRVLTTMANALEQGPDVPTAFATDGAVADTDRLGGPPENVAAWRSTGAAIARLAGELDQGARPCALLDAVRWEKSLLDQAIARIDAAERAGPVEEGSGGSNIDPLRLQAYLRQRPGCADVEVTAFRLIVGGRSRQTALFSITGGQDLPADMVIQRGIPGQVVASVFLDEVRQFDLLEQLFAVGMQVPRPILVERDAQWLDAAFMLVEQAPGSPVQPDYWLPATSEPVVLDLARQMALLHAQPVETVGRSLPQARERYDTQSWRDEIEGFAAAWHDRAHWPSINISAAIAWLRDNVECIDDRRTIVHNDMIFHNILAQDDRITAVLDWEQSAIGHPGEDLGYCFPVVIAVTDWNRFMDAYRAAGGADVTQRQIQFFALRAGLRLMGLVLTGGRDSFEGGLSDDVLVASAGAHFSQRLMHRIAVILDSILKDAA
ncbi:phosphotransferase family protein [Sphingobium sp. AN558]|uniref:phosphotransferase family protein n=1 Tax=Sphingobium sp. AN558 TaxID=3133442 RepID=UPI0030C478AD